MSIEELGKPLGSVYAINGGTAQLYERGASIVGTARGDIAVYFQFRTIARPEVSTATFSHDMRVESVHIDAQLQAVIQDALRDRISLVPVVAAGQPRVRIPLTHTGAKTLTATGLLDRQLYDVAVRGDDGWHVVAPHSVYARQSWTDFGIAHITDMHVAKRIDKFRGYLREARREDAAERMYNWNDRFRGFVRYANYLHSIGVLDVIVATGDNYDFQFENIDDRPSGGNAAFLRDLILGKAPGPDFPEDVEELRVPIFMVPGNHDYRKNPYKLVFDLRLDGFLRSGLNALSGGLAGQIDVSRISNFNGYHLSRNDAALIANRLEGRSGDDVQNLGAERAGEMVEVDRDLGEQMRPYQEYLGEPGSYVVELGPHRIAMIDSKHDVGVVTDQLLALLVYFGLGSEDQDMFVGGNPNCVGVDEWTLKTVREHLPGTEGLFIVGLHAPLFNPEHDGYAYFLRETQRAHYPDEVHAFLARNPITVAPGENPLKKVEAVHPTWFPAPGPAGSDRSPDYVKRVSSEDAFACGVSTGFAADLTKLLAGVGSSRKADLVLAGHTHFSNEYRIGKATNSDELAFYFDFYTQNPTNYYRTEFARRWRTADNVHVTVDTDTTFVEVMPGAEPDARPWQMPFVTDGTPKVVPTSSGPITIQPDKKHMVQVPPYANPLNSAPNPAAWWLEHRPLVLQTGALGPLRSNEFFSGFRVLAVKNNIIDKIHHVSTLRLEQNHYRLDWAEAIKPEPARQYQYVERSRPLKSPAAVGTPSAISFPANGSTTIVYRDGDGHLHELWRNRTDRGTSDLTTLGSNAMRAAGDPTSYIDTVDNLEVALYRGTDGHIYSLYWSTGEVRRDSLSAPINAPRAKGNPIGYVGKDNVRHVIYRAEDGHLEELWWTGGDPPVRGDISTPKGAPKAAGDPLAYQKPTTVENNVFYRGQDHHIHRLYWITGDAIPEDLSFHARAPDAAGDPTAYYTSSDDVHQVVYRSADGHLHELWWQGNNPVSHWDLTAAAKDLADGRSPAALAAMNPTGDPISYYNTASNTKHVIYRSKDGHLNELSWVPGASTPTYVDLTAWAVAPVAADKPAAFVVAPNTQSVLYRGDDNQIHEIRWSQPATAHEWAEGRLIMGALQPTQPVEPMIMAWHRAPNLRSK